MALKEVYFVEWCPKCKFEEVPGIDDPCNDCLTNAVNEDSHKPINYKEKDS